MERELRSRTGRKLPIDDLEGKLGVVLNKIFRSKDDIMIEGIGAGRLNGILMAWQTASRYDVASLWEGYDELASALIQTVREGNERILGLYHDELLEKIDDMSQRLGKRFETRLIGTYSVCVASSAYLIKELKSKLKEPTQGSNEHNITAVKQTCQKLTENYAPELLQEISKYVATGILRAISLGDIKYLDEVADEVGETAETLLEKGQEKLSFQLDGIYYLSEALLANLNLETRSAISSGLV